MEYTTHLFKSAANLSQAEALEALQDSDTFVPGSKIAGFYNQGGHWIAKVKIPKAAGENPFDEIDESPSELHEEKHDDHEESESPIEEAAEHKSDDHEDSETKKINELEKKIDLLLDALGISEKGEEPTSPEGPSADLPAAPAPKGGPARGPAKHEPLPPGSGAKLKPGEVPNKPGMTPVGAPAFASVKTAGCEGSCDEGACEHCDSKREANASMPPNSSSPGAGSSASTPQAASPAVPSCPKCGQSGENCRCGADVTSPTSTPATVASFTASKLDEGSRLTIRQAKAQLENTYPSFRVARIKRDGDAIHARMEKRADFLADSSASFSKEAIRTFPDGSWQPEPKDYLDNFRRGLSDHLYDLGQQHGESYKHDPELDYSEILGRSPEYGVGGKYNSPITVTRGYRDHLAQGETQKATQDYLNKWRNDQHDPMLGRRRDEFHGVTDNQYDDIVNEINQSHLEGPWVSGFNRGHFNQYGESPDEIGNKWETNPEIKQRYPEYQQTPEQPAQAPQQVPQQGQGLWDKAKGLFQGQPQQPAAQPAEVAPQWRPDPNEIF